MSVLAHYRDRLRGWGSQDMSFSTPPPLSYSPRPHWGGLHHYMAHASAVEPNPEIYEMALERAESGALGVGLHEARHFHRHAYGGLMDLARLSPAEIGHAAAYEAFRYLLHHEPLYEPLADETEREREVLVSLAVAEATKLWREAPRFNDEYGLQTACSSAAATASLLHSQKCDIGEIGPDYLTQRNASRPYGDTYAEDDSALCQRAGVAEPPRGRMYGRDGYNGSVYGGRGARALSEGPSYGGRDYTSGYGTGGAGMGGFGVTGSRDPRGLTSPIGGMDDRYPDGLGAASTGIPGPPMPLRASGPSAGMSGVPYTGGVASSLSDDPRMASDAGRSPYPFGAGGFVPSAGVPNIERADSPMLQGEGLGTSHYQQSLSQSGYPGSQLPPQPLYGGAPQSIYGVAAQPTYAGNGMPGTLAHMVPGGMASAMPQAGYGGAIGGSILRATPAQPAPGGIPGVPQGPYVSGPTAVVSQSAYPGAQVYPPGSTIVLPSRKRRHRRRARSRDLNERDRYYRERRYGDGYESY
ncbi:unnamed protein product [Peniophora sp. CBMAI 1063]|nr:unnamed protein product [Peniophora sp. CBMAI 1063]